MTKYITLIFSDRPGKPSENNRPKNLGGFFHNVLLYLKPLENLAKNLNRIAIFPPPYISMEKRHGTPSEDKYWDYYHYNHQVAPPLKSTRRSL